MKDFIAVVGNMDYQLVTFKHGERYRQACLDKGNSPATVAKKLRHLNRLFQLAVDRGQFERHPLKQVKPPKCGSKKVEVFYADECERILKVAKELWTESGVNWELLIIVAMTTGMRRGELLNAVWSDIDFEAKTMQVCPKKNTSKTWEWLVKDTDRRILPLADEVVTMLAEHQATQPEGYAHNHIDVLFVGLISDSTESFLQQ
jgi:integrase